MRLRSPRVVTPDSAAHQRRAEHGPVRGGQLAVVARILDLERGPRQGGELHLPLVSETQPGSPLIAHFRPADPGAAARFLRPVVGGEEVVDLSFVNVEPGTESAGDVTPLGDRKSTRPSSSRVAIAYAGC